MEIFVIIMVSLVGAAMLVATIYLLAYYSHPEDGGFGADLLAKIVMIIGMSLSWATVLMFPLDVSNARSDDQASFRMDIMWYIIYISTAAFVLIIIPAMIFWYEADEDDSCVSRNLLYLVFKNTIDFLSTYYYYYSSISYIFYNVCVFSKSKNTCNKNKLSYFRTRKIKFTSFNTFNFM